MFFKRTPAPEPIQLTATPDPAPTLAPNEVINKYGRKVFKGRWGYYSCDYATFLEAKEYHKLSLRDLRVTKRHDRYYAKLEKNRKGTPPPESMGTDLDHYKWILAEYRCARKPKADPDEVGRLDLPRDWRDCLRNLQLHYHV